MKIFVEDTNLGKSMRLEGTGFIPSADDFVQVIISWGIEPRDFSKCHKTEYTCQGEARWDEAFDLNTPPAQMALLVMIT